MRPRTPIVFTLLLIVVLLALGGQATAHHRDGHDKGPPEKAKGEGRALQPAPATEGFCVGDCPIQPGALVGTPEGFCTMNFVFRGGQRLYVGTAGHCFDRTGQRAEAEEQPDSLLSPFGGLFEFGTAVHVEFSEEQPSIDFALIEIDPRHHEQVNPAVRFWGGPTGVATPAETSTGDLLLQYGYGLGFDLTPVTRPRPRVLIEHDSEHYTSQSVSLFGDSGSPVLHQGTGKALGIDSRFNLFAIPPTTDAGPSVENIERRLSAAGFDVDLVTAPF